MPTTYTTYASLQDTTVFITGGASGIGKEIVHAFASQHAKIGFIDIDQANGERLEAQLRNVGVDIAFSACDLRDIHALKTSVSELQERMGAATVLVNNAAKDDRHDWADVNEAFYDERIATNLKHMFFMIQAVAPGMIEAGEGSIINLGSNSWWEAAGGMPVYTTSKAAIHGMTRSFARDLGPHRIRVNTIVPGWVKTKRQEELWMTPESYGAHLKRQCIPHPVEPVHVAQMVLFLASDASTMCTAHNFMVDAGSI